MQVVVFYILLFFEAIWNPIGVIQVGGVCRLSWKKRYKGV